METRPLAIYLNDHLAGSTVALELVRRTLGENRGTEFEAPIGRLATEIEEDRAGLRDLMDRVGVPRNHVKVIAAWAVEKGARLKLNGRLTGYSPLSRLVELEGLSLGVEGKAAMWRALLAVAPGDDRFDEARLAELLQRAEGQRHLLEDLRAKAAALAFGSAP